MEAANSDTDEEKPETDVEKETKTESETESEEKTSWITIVKRAAMGLFITLVVYGMLAYIIATELKKRNGSGLENDRGIWGNLTGCGVDTVMLRDRVCDDESNTERCVFDGGDCCLENKDTSMCTSCKCELAVDQARLEQQYKELRVGQLREDVNFAKITVYGGLVTVDLVINEQVCAVLCLSHINADKLNAWYFKKNKKQCQCGWVESSTCIENNVLEKTSLEESSPFQREIGYVQMGKTVACDCLVKNQFVDGTLTNRGRRVENAFSAYHCSQECHSDPECKVFSWKPEIERNCFLMYQNALEQGGKNIRWTNDGAVSSTKDCSILLDHFSTTTTTTTTTTEVTKTTTTGAFADNEGCDDHSIHDGVCDDVNNSPQCDYDMGDCCDHHGTYTYCEICWCHLTGEYRTTTINALSINYICEKLTTFPTCSQSSDNDACDQNGLGDGICDDINDKRECEYDFDDCCDDNANFNYCYICYCYLTDTFRFSQALDQLWDY